MIVYNITDTPIMVTTHWDPDPLGGAAINKTTLCIRPGDGADLATLGLSVHPPANQFQDRNIARKQGASRGGQTAQERKWQAPCGTCGHPKIDHAIPAHPSKRQTGPCSAVDSDDSGKWKCPCGEFWT